MIVPLAMHVSSVYTHAHTHTRDAYLLLAELESTLVLVDAQQLKASLLVGGKSCHLPHNGTHERDTLVLVLLGARKETAETC